MWLALIGIAAAEVLAAAHEGVWSPQGITWTSTYQTDATLDVTLLAPLPEGAVLEGATAEGRVLHLAGRRITVRQPGSDRLRPPLAEGAAVQRVSVDGAIWSPDAALGLEPRLLRHVDPAATRAGRLAANRLADRPAAGAAFVVADARFADGLPGEVLPGGAARPSASIGAAVAFALLLGGLALASRLKPRVDVEAYVREEFMRKE